MRVFVGVYWGRRREDAAQCALRLERHFDALAALSPNLGTWLHGSGSKRQQRTRIDTSSKEILCNLLREGVNRTDVDQNVIPELGFRVSLWNGDAGRYSASTSVNCGLYANTKNLSNVANLSIEFDETPSVPPPLIFKFFRSLIEIWEPETGKVEQGYIPPPYDGGDAIPPGEDILYALYQPATAGLQMPNGVVEYLGHGVLWTSGQLEWKA